MQLFKPVHYIAVLSDVTGVQFVNVRTCTLACATVVCCVFVLQIWATVVYMTSVVVGKIIGIIIVRS